MKKTSLMLILTFLTMTFLLQGVQVAAHTPASMNLSYDFSTQVLTVEVSHSVTDVNTHYIVTVTVDKNAVEVLSRSYSSQNTTSGFSATYPIPAVDGDELSVTAVCVISGQVTDDITVSATTTSGSTTSDTDTTTPNGGGTPMDLTLLIVGGGAALAIIVILVLVMKRR